MAEYEALIQNLRSIDEYDTGYAKLIYDAADAIEELEMCCNHLERDYKALCAYLPKWIPVTERLPEESWERVLAYTDDGTVMTIPAIKLRNGYVRYWMPLPEPPKEET